MFTLDLCHISQKICKVIETMTIWLTSVTLKIYNLFIKMSSIFGKDLNTYYIHVYVFM